MANSAIQSQPIEVDPVVVPGSLRNKIINGQFDIWQRGTSFDAPSGALPAGTHLYTADRWNWQLSGDNGTADLAISKVEQATFASGQTEVPDNPTFYMKWRGAFIGVVNGDEELSMTQQIENARTLAGQKATLSFWAKGDVAGTILVSTRQNLGIGGDISDFPIFVPVALTTSWQKFVVVLDVQSIVGKALGQNDQFLSLRFTSILGADVATLTGSITVNYTDTISLANVQFEEGDIDDPEFEDRDVGLELIMCQRYYELANREESNFATIGLTNEMWHNFKVTKRVEPSIIYNFFENPSTSPNIVASPIVEFSKIDGFGIRYEPLNTADATIIAANESPGLTRGPWSADAEL